MPKTATRKLSRTHKPQDMSLEAWQRELRRQFGREQPFRLKNVGGEPVFTEYQVTNRDTSGSYRVAIRGAAPGDNYCSCADFATNTLGTCKHIEFVLGRLERNRGDAPAPSAADSEPPYSEIVLQYGARREVRFRRGKGCPARAARPGRQVLRRTGHPPRRRVCAVRVVPVRRPPHRSTTSAATTMSWASSPRCATGATDAPDRGRLSPRHPRRGVPEAAEVRSLRLPARGRAVRRPRRPVPHRRRDGPRQDDPGHRRRRDHGAAVRRRARADRLPHLAQAPVGARDRPLHRLGRHQRRSAACALGARRTIVGADSFYKITNYDTVHRDLDLIAAWSPDLVILDEAQRIKNWNTRTARSVKRDRPRPTPSC